MSNYTQLSGTTANVDLTNFEYEQRSGSTVNAELSLIPFTISALVNSESVEIQEIFAQINGEVKEISDVFAQINGESRQV